MIWLALYMAFGAGCFFGVIAMWWASMDYDGWYKDTPDETKKKEVEPDYDQGYAKAHGHSVTKSENIPIDESWCIEPKPVNGLLSVEQESYADVVSHWHYWQNKADEYKLELDNLKEQQSTAWTNWNGAVNKKLKDNA